jgi:hypothetical protein
MTVVYNFGSASAILTRFCLTFATILTKAGSLDP